MRNRDLIEQLKALDPEAEAVANVGGTVVAIDSVEATEVHPLPYDDYANALSDATAWRAEGTYADLRRDEAEHWLGVENCNKTLPVVMLRGKSE